MRIALVVLFYLCVWGLVIRSLALLCSLQHYYVDVACTERFITQLTLFFSSTTYVNVVCAERLYHCYNAILNGLVVGGNLMMCHHTLCGVVNLRSVCIHYSAGT
jgi:hypothetical protein